MVWFVVGSGIGLLSQTFYVAWSGNDPSTFGSSFNSQLLWYRLMPSATYPLGVLPAILLATVPFILLCLSAWKSIILKTAWLRLAGLASIIALLFVGGILVSVKIGGGSNLHNLDAFLVSILISGVYLAGGRWRTDASSETSPARLQPAPLLAAIWIPVCFALGSGVPLRTFDAGQAQQALEYVQSMVDPLVDRGEEILFISQRHLLTFHQVTGVEMIPEYETVFLMEMAMSRNRAYLDRFHGDLSRHRFGLIVVDRLSTQIQGSENDFAEENNAWVEEVSTPILCSYTELAQLAKPPLEFLIPSTGTTDCRQ